MRASESTDDGLAVGREWRSLFRGAHNSVWDILYRSSRKVCVHLGARRKPPRGLGVCPTGPRGLWRPSPRRHWVTFSLGFPHGVKNRLHAQPAHIEFFGSSG